MFWGAIGIQKKIAGELEKDRNRSKPIDSCINLPNAAQAAAEKGTRVPKKIQVETYLTLQPLSEMSHQSVEASGRQIKLKVHTGRRILTLSCSSKTVPR